MTHESPKTDLDRAKAEFASRDASLVLVKDGRILGVSHTHGVGELLSLAETLGEAARGSALADRIVGKAAALIAVAMEVRAVYTPLMSEPAQRVLADHGIASESARLVPVILNRSGDGPCPMERRVADIEDPWEGVEALKLMRAGGAHGSDRDKPNAPDGSGRSG